MAVGHLPDTVNITSSLRLAFAALISLCILSVTNASQANANHTRIDSFLKTFVPEHNKHEKHGGIPVQFTGEYTTIPDELQQSLLATFPKHRFVVANMLYFHYTWYPGVHLFIVTDKDTGDVVSYAWDLWFSGVSDSFRGLLAQYRASSKQEALSKVQSLSELLVFPTKGRVGKLENKSGAIYSELYIRSDSPWRILRVKLDRRLRFGQMALINPQTGKDASRLSRK